MPDGREASATVVASVVRCQWPARPSGQQCRDRRRGARSARAPMARWQDRTSRWRGEDGRQPERSPACADVEKGLGGVGRGIGTRSWQRPLSSASRTAATSAVTAVEYGRTRIWSGPDRTTRARLAWHESGRTPAGRVLGGAVPRGSDGVSGRWVSGFPWGTGKRSAPGASGRHPNGPRPLAGSVRRRRIERVPKAAQIQDC